MNIIIFIIIKSINIKNIIFYVINKYFITRGAWASFAMLGHPCFHVTLRLLSLYWAHSRVHVALELVKIRLSLSPACYRTQNNLELLAVHDLK